MEFSWDWLVAALIIGGLVVGFWSKITGQKVTDIFAEIKEFFSGTKEEVSERIETLTYYE